MSGRRGAPSLSHSRDDLELDGNRRRQRCDLNRRASWVGFAGPGEILGVKPIVDWKIFFHVREKDCDVDDVLPRRACVFQNEPHVLENRAALRFDVVRDDVAGGIERHTGNFFAAPHARANAREEQQVAYAFRMRKRADRLRRARAFDCFAHFVLPRITRMTRMLNEHGGCSGVCVKRRYGFAESFRKILRARFSLISLCRGTGWQTFVSGF